MALLLDLRVDRPDFAANLAFARKATYNYIRNIVGSDSFLMWGFQENPEVGLSVSDEAGNGANGDITLSSGNLWTGSGWYRHFGKAAQAGNRGLGLVNTGGASTLYGSVPDNPLINLNGKNKFTILLKFIMNDTGGSGAGVLISKINLGFGMGISVLAVAANTIAVMLDDGVDTFMNTTGNTVVYGYWHDLAIVYDGTLSGDTNRLKLILDGRDVTTSLLPGIPSTITDMGNDLCLLNDGTFPAFAWNGSIGFAAFIPDVAFSSAQCQGSIELMGLFQPTAANQPLIHGPGSFGCPQYDFDGAAPPNSDYLLTFQVNPLKTAAGSFLAWFNIDAFSAVDNMIAAFSTYATAVDDFLIDATNGNFLYAYLTQAGVTTMGIRETVAETVISKNHFIAMTSNGSTLRFYLNGNNKALNVVIGANNGQWFASAANSNSFCLGVLPRAPTTARYNGKESKILIYDRALAQVELQKINRLGFNNSGPVWYPSS